MNKLILILSLVSISFSAIAQPSGALNPYVTQQTIDSTICVPGYSASVRPSVSYTNALKVKQIRALGYTDTSPQSYEEDHFIPLGIGGHPRSPSNLWPEAYAGNCGARTKDRLESVLHTMICKRKILLVDAQKEIANDWVLSYNKHVGKLVCIK